MTTLEGNKLIAEFMGARYDDKYNPVQPHFQFPDACFDIDELKYHTSWDWLMPVVEKINKTWEYSELDGDDFLPGETIIRLIAGNLANVDIEGAHYQVCQFIQWYNQNSK